MNVNEGKLFEVVCPADDGDTIPDFSTRVELADATCNASYSVVFSAGDLRVGAIIHYQKVSDGNSFSAGFKHYYEFEAGSGKIEILFKGEGESPERLVKGIILRTK